jgi:hypothetical protein
MEWIFGPDARLALAGALGGAVSWLTRRGSVIDGIVQIVVGAICAVYLSPLAIPAMNQAVGPVIGTPEELARLSGFVLGIGGVSVSGFILDLMHLRRLAISRKETCDDE